MPRTQRPRTRVKQSAKRHIFFSAQPTHRHATAAHGVAGQHVGGRGRSRVRSNGAEPYLIACGVHGGASAATEEVGGENCARGATAERGPAPYPARYWAPARRGAWV